jgi:hypothetical protein
VVTQPTFEMLKPAELHVPPSRLDTVEGFPFEFEIGRRMVQEPRSSTKGSRNPMTQKNIVMTFLVRECYGSPKKHENSLKFVKIRTEECFDKVLNEEF